MWTEGKQLSVASASSSAHVPAEGRHLTSTGAVRLAVVVMRLFVCSPRPLCCELWFCQLGLERVLRLPLWQGTVY